MSLVDLSSNVSQDDSLCCFFNKYRSAVCSPFDLDLEVLSTIRSPPGVGVSKSTRDQSNRTGVGLVNTASSGLLMDPLCSSRMVFWISGVQRFETVQLYCTCESIHVRLVASASTGYWYNFRNVTRSLQGILIWVCLKMEYTPNEIAIKSRDM